jgi:phosphoribosylamine-glycine ligase
MKFRFVTRHGDGLGFALRMKQEGHDIDYWIHPQAKEVFKGILPQVKGVYDNLKKDTIVIFDTSGFGDMAEKLKKEGYPIWGAGKINDLLEDDREFGFDVARNHDILLPEYEHFNSFSDAKKFISEEDGDKIWIFKPCCISAPSSWTYCPKDNKNLILMLDYYDSVWDKIVKDSVDFILQEKIEGIQYSSEAWYSNGKKCHGLLCEETETKKFMDFDKGISTGCESTLLKFVDESSFIYQATLKKLEPFLKSHKYHAPLDINTIVTEDWKCYFLEFTPRFGYSSTFPILAGINEPIGEYLASLAMGNPMDIFPTNQWCGCVKVSIPPYPNPDGSEKVQGVPVEIDDEDDAIWLSDLQKSKNGQLVSAGYDGTVAEITSIGDIESVDDEIYEKIKEITAANLQYRKDGISVLKERIEELESFDEFV